MPLAAPARRAPLWVDAAFLDQRVGLTAHALEQFARRAQPPAVDAAYLHAALRDLVLAEGLIVVERPHWARSRNHADLYIQVGEFLLLICRHDRLRPGAFTCVTVLNGRSDTTWRTALERGWTRVPPPPPRPTEPDAAEYRARRAALKRQSLSAVPPPAPAPKPARILPFTPARWRRRRAAARAHRDERDRRRRAHDAPQANWLSSRLADLEREQHAAHAALAHWEHELWPAYTAAWSAARAAARDAPPRSP